MFRDTTDWIDNVNCVGANYNRCVPLRLQQIKFSLLTDGNEKWSFQTINLILECRKSYYSPPLLCLNNAKIHGQWVYMWLMKATSVLALSVNIPGNFRMLHYTQHQSVGISHMTLTGHRKGDVYKETLFSSQESLHWLFHDLKSTISANNNWRTSFWNNSTTKTLIHWISSESVCARCRDAVLFILSCLNMNWLSCYFGPFLHFFSPLSSQIFTNLRCW